MAKNIILKLFQIVGCFVTLTSKYPKPSSIPHWKQSSVFVEIERTLSGLVLEPATFFLSRLFFKTDAWQEQAKTKIREIIWILKLIVRLFFVFGAGDYYVLWSI